MKDSAEMQQQGAAVIVPGLEMPTIIFPLTRNRG